jgi:tetratricopeptide (TPR) repeat protein
MNKHSRSAICAVALLTSALTPAALFAHPYEHLLDAKKYAEAERAIAARLSAEPGNPELLAARVDLLVRKGDETHFPEAVRLGEQCVGAWPRRSDCQEALGMALGATAQHAGMLTAMRHAGRIREALTAAVELDRENYRALFFLMQFYLQAPEMMGGGGARARELVAQTRPRQAGAAALLQAHLDLHERNVDRATDTALRAAPVDAPSLALQQRGLLMAIAQARFDEKDYVAAERLYGEIMRRFPQFYGGYFGAGKLLQLAGKPEAAVPMLETSLRMEDYAGAHFRLGKCWQAMGDRAKAIAAYETALRTAPPMNASARVDAERQLKALRP